MWSMTLKDHLRKKKKNFSSPNPLSWEFLSPQCVKKPQLDTGICGLHQSHQQREEQNRIHLSYKSAAQGASFSVHSVLQMTNAQSVFVLQLMMLLGNPLLGFQLVYWHNLKWCSEVFMKKKYPAILYKVLHFTASEGSDNYHKQGQHDVNKALIYTRQLNSLKSFQWKLNEVWESSEKRHSSASLSTYCTRRTFSRTSRACPRSWNNSCA